MKRINNLLLITILVFVLISCRTQQSHVSHQEFNTITVGLYLACLTPDSSVFIYVNNHFFVFIDALSVPDDTVATVFEYAQLSDHILRLKGFESDGCGIKVSESYSSVSTDSIEVYVGIPHLTSTTGKLDITFYKLLKNGYAGQELYSRHLNFDPMDSTKSTFMIPNFKSDSDILVEAIFAPDHYKSISGNKQTYCGALSFFADHYWDIYDRSDPIVHPSDSLAKIDISLDLQEADLVKPNLSCRLILFNNDNNSACIYLDDLKFENIPLTPEMEHRYNSVIKMAKETLLDE